MEYWDCGKGPLEKPITGVEVEDSANDELAGNPYSKIILSS